MWYLPGLILMGLIFVIFLSWAIVSVISDHKSAVRRFHEDIKFHKENPLLDYTGPTSVPRWWE